MNGIEVNGIEAIGYLGTVLTVAASAMSTMIPLRIVALMASVAVITYGVLIGSMPVVLTEAIQIPFNAFRLYQMVRLVRDAERAADGDLSLAWLRPFGQGRRFRAGETLFREGEPATELFYVESGLFRIPEHGIAVGPGAIVGELGMLPPGDLAPGSLVCVEAGSARCIAYSEVKQLYYQNPEFGFYFPEAHQRAAVPDRVPAESGAGARRDRGALRAPTAPEIYRSWRMKLSGVPVPSGDEADVAGLAPGRVDGEEDHRLLEDLRHRVDDAALEHHELAGPDLHRSVVGEPHAAAAREHVEVLVAARMGVGRRRPVDPEHPGAGGRILGESMIRRRTCSEVSGSPATAAATSKTAWARDAGASGAGVSGSGRIAMSSCAGSLPQSMLGRIRSGGRWPSMKVLMLMMTFSPMSTRPSKVAEPICGRSTTLPFGRA